MTTNQSEDEGLREQVEAVMLGDTPRQFFSDNMLKKTDTIMALISQKIIEARIAELSGVKSCFNDLQNAEEAMYIESNYIDQRITTITQLKGEHKDER